MEAPIPVMEPNLRISKKYLLTISILNNINFLCQKLIIIL